MKEYTDPQSIGYGIQKVGGRFQRIMSKNYYDIIFLRDFACAPIMMIIFLRSKTGHGGEALQKTGHIQIE